MYKNDLDTKDNKNGNCDDIKYNEENKNYSYIDSDDDNNDFNQKELDYY